MEREFIIKESVLVEILKYFNTRPHGEVRNLFDKVNAVEPYEKPTEGTDPKTE